MTTFSWDYREIRGERNREYQSPWKTEVHIQNSESVVTIIVALARLMTKHRQVPRWTKKDYGVGCLPRGLEPKRHRSQSSLSHS
ncbi:2-iminobutanoate/2-iminopropanoate deaminase [Fusarium oxysporum f. sp. albedinis]|nr:2-iminobutanoate/2-iminopropanoate deaminase [Fusarium oxysporum f. sp. albedinis]